MGPQRYKNTAKIADMDNIVDSSLPGIFRASELEGSYPRPQLIRPARTDLSMDWNIPFHDNADGVSPGWQLNPELTCAHA